MSPDPLRTNVSTDLLHPSRKRRVAAAMAASLAVLVMVIGLWPDHRESSPPETLGSPLVLQATPADRVRDELTRVNNPGYVGPEVCGTCHSERWEEFQHTGHFRTCREPVPQTMPRGFEPGEGDFETRYPHIRFEMTKRGDRFVQTAIHQTPAGEEKTTTPIALIYGAGTADEIYLAWDENGDMFELPMAWLYTHDCWAAEYFDPYGSGDFSRPLTLRCLECHNTWFQHVPGTANRYRREGFIAGVTCERCHGPGREHVAFHQANPEATDAAAIVNPADLPRERQLEVCTQCHSNAMKHRGPALSYRPGKALKDSYQTLISRRSDEDHVANQIQYLRDSGCFQQSDMTCATCHDPHQARDATNSGSVTCMQCHSHSDCGEQSVLPVAVREDCVGCHMPARLKINVNFQTENDLFAAVLRRHEHRIAVDPIARDEVLLKYFQNENSNAAAAQIEQLTDRLVDHWTRTAQVQQDDHRYFAAIASLREALAVKELPELHDRLQNLIAIQSRIYADWDLAMHQIGTKQFDAAITTLEELLRIQPDHASARGRLGTMYAVTGRSDEAAVHLQQVSLLDPNDAYGHGMLGWLAFLDGQYDQALQEYARARDIEPYNFQIEFRTGLVLSRLGRDSEAIDHLQRAREIDPLHVETRRGLCLALRRTGRIEEAVSLARQTVDLSGGENISDWMTLAETLAEAGQIDEAIRVADQAKDIAARSEPTRVPQIERQRRRWQKQAEEEPAPR